MGRLGQVDHPEVVSAIARITNVCQSANIPLGVFGLTVEAVQPYIDQGYTLILAGVDTLMLAGAAKQLLAQLKA